MPPTPMGGSTPGHRRKTSGTLGMENLDNSSPFASLRLNSSLFQFPTVPPLLHSPTSHAHFHPSHFLPQLPTPLSSITLANSITTTTSTLSPPPSPPPTPSSSPPSPAPPPPSPARCLSLSAPSRKTSVLSCPQVSPSFTSSATSAGPTLHPRIPTTSEGDEEEEEEEYEKENEEPTRQRAMSSRSCHRASSLSHSPPPLLHPLPSRTHQLMAELRLPLPSSQTEEEEEEEEEVQEENEVEEEEVEEGVEEVKLDDEDSDDLHFFDDNSNPRLQYSETSEDNQQQEPGSTSSGGASHRRGLRPNARHPLHLSCALLLLLAPSLLEPRNLVTATELPSTSEVNILQDNKAESVVAQRPDRTGNALRTTQLRHHPDHFESVPPQSPFMLQPSSLVTPSTFPTGGTSGAIGPGGIPIAATVIAQHGAHAFLPCTVRSLGNKSVSWIRGRDSHILTIDRYTFIADERFRARYEAGTGTWTLQIKYVQPRDQGLYECQVSTEPKISHILNLTVITPHVVIDGGSELHVRSGSTVTIKCVIYNSIHDPEYIFWYRDDERIAPATTDEGRKRFVTTSNRRKNHMTMARFTLLSAALSDAGNYTCSPAGLKSASVSLHVLEDERPAAMQHEQGTTTSTASAARPTSSSPRSLQPMSGWMVHLLASVGPLWSTAAFVLDLRFRLRTASKS